MNYPEDELSWDTLTFPEFYEIYHSAPIRDQMRWCAAAGIPAMARKRDKLVREARERLGLPKGATEEMIIYEEMKLRYGKDNVNG